MRDRADEIRRLLEATFRTFERASRALRQLERRWPEMRGWYRVEEFERRRWRLEMCDAQPITW